MADAFDEGYRAAQAVCAERVKPLEARVAALEAELKADLRLWEPLIGRLNVEDAMTGLLQLRVASIRATLGATRSATEEAGDGDQG